MSIAVSTVRFRTREDDLGRSNKLSLATASLDHRG